MCQLGKWSYFGVKRRNSFSISFSLIAYCLLLNEFKYIRCRKFRKSELNFKVGQYKNVEQWWCSGESTPLTPMWPRFISQVWCHMWVKFVVGSLPCSRSFFSGYPSFPLSSKTNISKFQLNQESGRWRTTIWMCYLQIVIYFIYFFIFWGLHDVRVQWAMSSSTQHASSKYIYRTDTGFGYVSRLS